jgi:hypothetical protein
VCIIFEKSLQIYHLKNRNMNRIYKLLAIVFLLPFATKAQLTITSGGSITMSGDALLTLDNADLINNGTFNQASGTVRFTGNGNNNISGSQLTKIHVLQMAKTGAAQLQLQRTLNVGSQISFTSGIINLNNNNILLDPAATLSGETEASRITGTNGGCKSRQSWSSNYICSKSWVNNNSPWAYSCK